MDTKVRITIWRLELNRKGGLGMWGNCGDGYGCVCDVEDRI